MSECSVCLRYVQDLTIILANQCEKQCPVKSERRLLLYDGLNAYLLRIEKG